MIVDAPFSFVLTVVVLFFTCLLVTSLLLFAEKEDGEVAEE